MRPILLIMWSAFQSFILRHNNNNNNNNNNKPDEEWMLEFKGVVVRERVKFGRHIVLGT